MRISGETVVASVFCVGDSNVIYCWFVVGFVSMCFVCNLKFGTVVHLDLKDCSESVV
jgi:hypothetical protein